MNILSAIQTGLSELTSHKLRSLLTMLGVIFGVAAVIAMVSIGEGAKREAVEQINKMGIDVVHVKRSFIGGEALEEAQEKSPYGLRYSDYTALRQICTFAHQIICVREVFGDVRMQDKPIKSSLVGVSAGYDKAVRARLAKGRFVDSYDVDNAMPVCVIGADIKRDLFGFNDPVEKKVKIGNEQFTVIGYLEPKGIVDTTIFAARREIDRDIYIPISVSIRDFQLYSQQAIPANIQAVRKLWSQMTVKRHVDNEGISEIILQLSSAEETVPTASVVEKVLERRHEGIEDYEIVVPSELLRQSQETQRIFNIVMAAIASISLLVGGIGIMNIMLATVTQRTREIGIRRCIGATRWDIVRQFMLEAMVITSLGGLIGIALGVAGADFISAYANWRTIVSVQAIVVSFGVSAMVGVVFGLYPAIRAAMVDPIEALRYS